MLTGACPYRVTPLPSLLLDSTARLLLFRLLASASGITCSCWHTLLHEPALHSEGHVSTRGESEEKAGEEEEEEGDEEEQDEKDEGGREVEEEGEEAVDEEASENGVGAARVEAEGEWKRERSG